MMLIIEIHVDTIENPETNPSTQTKREDERQVKAENQIINHGNRFWKAVKISFPDFLAKQNKNE
jgi:hypothetical protein